MNPKILRILTLVSFVAFSVNANALLVSWIDWTAVTTAPTGAVGNISVDGQSIDAMFTGDYSFVQTDSGTNWWSEGTPPAYTSGEVENAPSTPDIIGLSTGGEKTVTFSQTVVDPYLALVSWNSNTVDFGDDVLDFISSGQGHWGAGTFIPNSDNTGFFGSGELHGIIRLSGEFDSFTFTDTSEGWHGFTVGIGAAADDNGNGTVPAPATLALLGIGLAGLGWARRRKA